jgi:hypothetical protein
MAMTGHKTESVGRRYAIVSDSDLREPGARLAAVTMNGDSLGLYGDSRDPGRLVVNSFRFNGA